MAPSKRDPSKVWTVAEIKEFVSKTLASGVSVARLLVEQSLYLEVRARTQSASWVFRYTYAGTKGSMGFGRWPGAGLKEATDKAQHARTLISQGVSPIEAKRTGLQGAAERKLRTVDAAIAEWLTSDAKKLTSPKYAAQKARRIYEVTGYRDTASKVRKLGDMSVALVTTENVTDSLDVLVKRGTHETARRVLADLEKAFDWARAKGWRSEANPCSGVGVTIDRPKKEGHRAPNIGEVGAIVSGLQAAQGEGTGLDFDYDTRLARLLLLTGARTSELRLARWDEVFDLDGDMPRIDVPATRMKKRKPWTCALSTQSATILRELRDNAAQRGDAASPLIFMKYKKSGLGVVCHENAVNLVLRKAGVHDKVVGHGFRKLFSTAAYSVWPYRGNNRERAIEHSLAHVNSDTVEETYNKSKYLTERRILLQWWADHLDMAAAGEAAGNVLEFKQVG